LWGRHDCWHNDTQHNEIQHKGIIDKLKPTGQNLGRVFHCRLGHTFIGHEIVHITKQTNLKLNTWPKQFLGSIPLAFALPDKGLFVTLSIAMLFHYALCRCAECCDFFIIMLSIIMLSVIMLNVVAPIVGNARRLP
jgi:hypothetical protein